MRRFVNKVAARVPQQQPQEMMQAPQMVDSGMGGYAAEYGNAMPMIGYNGKSDGVRNVGTIMPQNNSMAGYGPAYGLSGDISNMSAGLQQKPLANNWSPMNTPQIPNIGMETKPQVQNGGAIQLPQQNPQQLGMGLGSALAGGFSPMRQPMKPKESYTRVSPGVYRNSQGKLVRR